MIGKRLFVPRHFCFHGGDRGRTTFRGNSGAPHGLVGGAA